MLSSEYRVLRTTYWTSILLALLLVLLFETGILPDGQLAHLEGPGIIVTAVMEVLTIVLIPVALKFVAFSAVRRRIDSATARGILHIFLVRHALLALPLLANTLLYYLFQGVAFGYLAIISLLSMAFIAPGQLLNQQK